MSTSEGQGLILMIPMGGTGERFKAEGAIEPKALISVEGKPILFWLLDELLRDAGRDLESVVIPYNLEYEQYNLEHLLRDRYPDVVFELWPLKAIVVKLSNLGNELSKVAQQLDMYAKEAYFYGSLRSLLRTFINVPEYQYLTSSVHCASSRFSSPFGSTVRTATSCWTRPSPYAS